ncbi:YdeI/OmpD-associated family protein [Microbulbifer variabilis]|uniref:YdeI/OmpD-associated family protein n=1 Tax=Microbulbifer variabilis TaxID=266805 RepID=UPI001CFE5C87|nr:YdeI/OmpD-associated family protein [Microbulbifer variabilis]
MINKKSKDTSALFQAKLHRPKKAEDNSSWAFIVLPKDASDKLPRRGRTTVVGSINNHQFQAMLEPDGKLSHWLQVNKKLQKAAGIDVGDIVTLEIRPVDKEPDPEIPSDLMEALASTPEAKVTWNDTTNIARLDWIHWITSAKQSKTRAKRVNDACNMLAKGKKRVCCFDQSGYYSKAFSAPEAED